MRRNLTSPSSGASRGRRRGQSMIEALIAISALTVGFLGMTALLARSLVLNRTISDQVTANYLAEEGIELAKNLIDHDVFEAISGNSSYVWGSCFTQQGNPEEVEMDYTTTDCSTLTHYTGVDFLKYDPFTHLYSYNPDPNDDPVTTGFTREIQVTTYSDASTNDYHITVDSIVRWDTAAGAGQSIDLEDVFYDWRPE